MTRNESSTSIGRRPFDRGHADLVARDEVDLVERCDAEETRSMCGEEDLVASLGEAPEERRRYRCACGARNSSGSSIAKTTPEISDAQASSPRMRATRGAGARASAAWITS
jgi:hypothetical protein